MTTVEAAEFIGCTPAYVRYLARTNQIAARQVVSSNNQYGHEWEVPEQEARRIRDNYNPRGKGRPRINPRNRLGRKHPDLD